MSNLARCRKIVYVDSKGEQQEFFAYVEKEEDGFDKFLDEEDIDIENFVLPSQPECHICMLPLPFDGGNEDGKSLLKLQPCCGYVMCRACEESSFYGALKRGIAWDKAQKCPFCNCKQVTSRQQFMAALNRLVERGNIDAMYNQAKYFFQGNGVPTDKRKGMELLHVAARAGSHKACRHLAILYFESDYNKAMRLFTRGAKLGDSICLYNVGMKRKAEDMNDSVHYFLKSASAGFQLALDEVKQFYLAEYITKDEYARALRSFQSAHDKVKSEARTKFNKRLADNQTMNDLSSMTITERLCAITTVIRCDFPMRPDELVKVVRAFCF